MDIKSFIGVKAQYDDFGGGYIWGVRKDGTMQMIADVRGWGAIQNLFKGEGELGYTKSEEFQDRLGQFIAEAITEKIQRESK